MERKSFLPLLSILLLFMIPTLAFAEGAGEQAVDFGWLSILPPIIAIALAFITKQVLLSLFVGIFVGATMLNGWNPFYGFLRTFDEFLVGSMTDRGNVAVLIFLIVIGGMVGVINKMGGTVAIAEALSKKVKDARSAQLATWFLGIILFFDDYANLLIVGSTMSPLSDRMYVSKEKLSYIMDTSSASVVGMALISTWVGYEVGIIKNVFEGLGIEVSHYSMFIRSIPYSFYNIFNLFLALLIILLSRDYGPMYEAEMRERSNPISTSDMDKTELADGIKLKVSNALIPILTLVVVAFAGLWYNGYMNTEVSIDPFSLVGLRTCFGNAESSIVLLWASAVSSMVAMIMGIYQKIFTIGEAFDAWVEGGKSMTMACIILALAWSLGTVTERIGTAKFLVGIASDKLPFAILPMLVFFISAATSFATGTAWGAMAIVLPLAIPLAYSFVPKGGNPEMIVVTLSSVLSGSICGGHCSPISDTTILSSMMSGCGHLNHVKTQMPYVLTSAIVSSICYTIIGFTGMNVLWALLIGFAIIFGVVKFIGKPVPKEYIGKEGKQTP